MQSLNGFTRFFQVNGQGAIGYFADISNPFFLAQTSLFVIQTFVGDGILVGFPARIQESSDLKTC
jgi:hypothetical protein